MMCFGSFLLIGVQVLAVSLTNSVATLSFDRAGRMVSLRERATDRELVERPVSAVALLDGEGRETGPSSFSVRDGRLVWGFADGEASASVRPFDGGWRFTLDACTVPGWKELVFMRLLPACRAYSGWRSNILSDELSAVSVRAYQLEAKMCVNATQVGARLNRAGQSVGLAAGPRGGFLASMRAMTLDAGVPHSPGGGAWSVGSDVCRRSYLHAVAPTARNVDDFIALCERGGFGTLHFREGWFRKFGHYRVNTEAFPGGRDELKGIVDRIHAAGLKAGFHTLTLCIDPEDEWVRSDEIANLIARASYTLAEPLAADATELRVDEPPVKEHDVVFTYSGNGNAIRIGREIVQYAGVRREKPYAFTGLKRGAFGTPSSAHAAGDRADYLRQRYLAFYPVPGSTLMGKAADAIAETFNFCGFDQIYCDGAEGMGDEYGVASARAAVAARLAPDGRPVVNEGALGGAHTWWFHSRSGNLDCANWAPKRFHDLHMDGTVRDVLKSNFLTPQVGWWPLKLDSFHARLYYLDEAEYYAGKNAAADLPMSLVAQLPEKGPLPFHAMRMLTVLGWYERARLERAFTDEAIAALGEPKSEFRLLQSPRNGRWHLVRVTPPGLKRVECPYGAAPYGAPQGRTILSAADLPALKVSSAKGVKASVRGGSDATHGETVVFAAENGTGARRGAWAAAARAFARPDYFNGAVTPGPTNVALSAWIKGDGSGALLNVQLENPREHGAAWQEHYVTLDFTGWRNFSFTLRDNDAARWGDYVWPYKDWVGVYHRTVFRGRIGAVNLYLNEVPAKGRAEVEVAGVRVVPMTERTLPAGEQPFGLRSGEFAQLECGAWVKYDKDGEPLERRATDAKAEFAIGRPIPAFTEDGVRRIRYEAMMPQLWDPSRGFDRLEPVAIRPGERATVEVKVFGDAAAKVSVGEETCTGSGSFGVLSGVHQVRVASASPVRLEFVKRYRED